MERFNEEKLKRIVAKRIELFRKKPEAAVYRPKVSSRLICGLYTETSARGHTVKVDYAEPAGGTDRGPNPIELLLSALAACIEAAFYEFALHEGITVNSLSIDVGGELDLRGLFMVDDSVPAGFREIVYTLHIDSPDDEGRVRDLAERVIAHCPVVESLKRPVSIRGEISIGSMHDTGDRGTAG